MRIKEIFPNLDGRDEIEKLKTRGISDDSRQVKKGDVFFVRSRKHFDIFSILKDVEEKAVAFVGDSKNKRKLKAVIKEKPLIIVRDVNREFLRVVDKFYGFNKSDFNCLAITGTNGKTTTASLIYYLLKKLGRSASLIGTVNYRIGYKTYKSTYTTPDYLSLRKILKKIKGEGCKFVVMEVSSHGAEQERIKGIEFSRCIFTNLTRDHLDYHKTMSNYFNAKKKLFVQNKKAISIINIDDPYGREVLKVAKRHILYGIRHRGDFTAEDIRWRREGGEFNLRYRAASLRMKTKILGRHNILNILAAVGTVSSLGFPLRKIAGAISEFKGVEGRLQQVAPHIFIDYAHTPHALKEALCTLREIGYRKIVCVFGCGGDRDKGKREIMGGVACSYAHFTIITSDNSRSEDPLKICCDIKKGFKKGNYSIVVDREKAIEQAMKRKGAGNRCCVVIAGKGHEDYQLVGDKRIPFKDKEVVRELLRRPQMISK